MQGYVVGFPGLFATDMFDIILVISEQTHTSLCRFPSAHVPQLNSQCSSLISP
jgi:hypothetical protein